MSNVLPLCLERWTKPKSDMQESRAPRPPPTSCAPGHFAHAKTHLPGQIFRGAFYSFVTLSFEFDPEMIKKLYHRSQYCFIAEAVHYVHWTVQVRLDPLSPAYPVRLYFRLF